MLVDLPLRDKNSSKYTRLTTDVLCGHFWQALLDTMLVSKITYLIVRMYVFWTQLKHPQNATSTEHQAWKAGIKVFFNYITSAWSTTKPLCTLLNKD